MSAVRRTRQSGELAVAVGRQFDLLDLPTALDRRQRVLRAGLVPPHGDAVLAGQRHAQQLLGVDVELRAEAATDRRCDDPHLVLGYAQGDRRHHLEDVRDLGGRVQGDVAAERLRHGDDGAGLHGHRDQPLLHVALAHRVGGGGERLVDRTLVLLDLECPRVARVGPEVVVDDDPVGQGVLEVDHGFQRLVLDVDRLDRVAGRRLVPGDHDRDPVAHVVHLVLGQREVRRVLHVVRDRPRARHRCRPQVGDVGARVGGDDAGQLECAGHVDTGDAGVGVGAAQHREVQGAWDIEVVGEPGLAREQGGVLPTQHALADHRGGWRGFG